MKAIWYIVLAVGIIGLGAYPLIGRMLEPVPIQWTNAPFPTVDPVRAGEPLLTTISRCNSTDHVIITLVARRLINEDTGEVTTLVPGDGIVSPGCSTQTGGIGLPPGVLPGRYHIDQYVRVDGRWQTFYVPLRTQTFTVIP